MFSLPLIAEQRGAWGFKEGGLIEWSQLSMVIGMGLIFGHQSVAKPQARTLYTIFTCLFAFVAIRETDSLWDTLGINWKLAYVLILYAIYVGYANFQTLKEQFRVFLQSSSMPLIWAGFIIVIPFAQLVGNGDFLRAAMGDDYSRDYKRVIEEVCEVMGYLLMLLGIIELLLESRRQAPRAE